MNPFACDFDPEATIAGGCDDFTSCVGCMEEDATTTIQRLQLMVFVSITDVQLLARVTTIQLQIQMTEAVSLKAVLAV